MICLRLQSSSYSQLYVLRPVIMCAILGQEVNGSSMTAQLIDCVRISLYSLSLILDLFICFSDDKYNIPEVVDVSQELQEWIYSSDGQDRLIDTPMKNTPGYVRRFIHDIYMCIYIATNDDAIDDVLSGYSSSESLVDDSKSGPVSSSIPDSAENNSSSIQQSPVPNTESHLENLLNKEEQIVDENAGSLIIDDVIGSQDVQHSESLALKYEEVVKLLKKERKTSRDLANQVDQLKLELKNSKKKMNSMEAEMKQILEATENSWKISHTDITLSENELGRGGWGVVWIGEFRGQKVAVKQLHDEINRHYRKLLDREIQTMARLRHPNLLQFIGAVFDDPSGYPMIITEVMDTSLRKAYESKELTPDPSCRPVILSILHDVAVGLNYLHCLPDPIIHRDVSSANVLLESKGPGKWKTKISDFGSANAVQSAVTKAPGALVYSAPESYQGISTLKRNKRKQTIKMDSFSFGILFCEVLTCSFPEDDDTFDSLLEEVKNSSSNHHSLIVRCIDGEPDVRPTMSQIIEEL